MPNNFWTQSLRKTSLTIAGSALLIVSSCDESPEKRELDVLGPYQVVESVRDGKMVTDTVFTPVKAFHFTDQDSNAVTEKTVTGKVYVADFFFTSCPTICPKMKQQMLRVQEAFANEDGLVILSHSIDPERDSVGRLKNYADKLGVKSDKWHMLTGERDSIYGMARHYMIAAQEDKLAPGGFAHSGAFLLVDRERFIRGIYDGTSPEEVDDLIKDIEWLLTEKP